MHIRLSVVVSYSPRVSLQPVSALQHHSLPYLADAGALFAALRALPWAMWLDSGGGGQPHGRYDVLVAAPRRTLVTYGTRTRIEDAQGVRESSDDPLSLLRRELPPGGADSAGLPFAGGAVGYFGYDLGMQLEGLADRRSESGLPRMAVGLYDWALISDHQARRTHWVGRPGARPAFRELTALLARKSSVGAFTLGAVSAPQRDEYLDAFARVQAYIHAGDCYQVNLARPFRADFRGDPLQAYRSLREFSPAPFGAYLELPFGQLLCNSPERFLQLSAGRVQTRPIKGTRPRRSDPGADALERQALLASAKDRAENVMIVDLLRNDLGKSCATGSVRVDELCALESYASVHHLVSTVSGRLRPGATAVDLLRGCLPGGSITGAPKRRAMEIIRELEPQRRGPYCGAIGYIGYDGAMDSNIAIRTLVCSRGTATYWAGGGVVADSTADGEYREIHHKAAAFLRLAALFRGESGLTL